MFVAAGLVARTLWPVLAGSFLWGIGQGFAYAQGLILLTAGMTPVEQGRSTSLYACSSYGFAAVMILVAGAFSSAWGYSYGSAGAVTILSSSVWPSRGRAGVGGRRPSPWTPYASPPANNSCAYPDRPLDISSAWLYCDGHHD